MRNQKRLFRALMREKLRAFTQRVFRQIAPGQEFHANWHIDAMAYHLQKCVTGETKRLIITVPPRHLKSILASVALPAFILGRDPTKNVICASYSERLSAKHSLDFRSIVSARWYRDLFPAMRADRRKNTELEFVTTQNGGRLSTSVEGTLTGRGGDIFIIDDPIKPDDAMSEAERTRVNEWFDRTAYSRLNSQKDGVFIIVMQRLHEEDLVGHVQENEDWTVLNIPAIAEEDLTYRFGDDVEEVYLRGAGEVIDPTREDHEELERMRQVLGSFNFAAQYQQAPMPTEGNHIKRAWFRTYEAPPEDRELDAIIHSWDTASAAGELNDFSVGTVWGVIGEDYYLLEVVREKLEYPDLRRRVLNLAERDKPQVILIEDAGTGRPLLQEIWQETDWYVRAMTPRGDKVVRLVGQSAKVEQGRVLLPEDASWRDAFLTEVLAFPGARHDDQVDSFEMFLRYMDRPQGVYPGARLGLPRPRPQGPAVRRVAPAHKAGLTRGFARAGPSA